MLQKAGHKVVASDLVDRSFGQDGVDFFQCQSFPEDCQAMVTNPPYGDGGIGYAWPRFDLYEGP